MSLASGKRLGPYEILALLGAGGMGEVYRARDTRLDRTVAIKILPAHLSNDLLCKQRFDREAQTISNLSHPHICVLYDVGHQDGVDYLVMECVEGETLAKRLEKGPLPLDQALKYAAQIADALDKAHCSGVIHRDLKPGNIMLTPAGIKLLDFGLAKPVAPLTSLATLTATKRESPVTEQGVVVGTFQYMSPEQIEGSELDGRSDIFSLGAVVYEMLTGRRAFEGKSQLSVASAILQEQPTPITTTKPMTPPALERAVRQCLAKEPEDRWQSARDLELELKWIAEGAAQATPTAASLGKGIRPLGKTAVALGLGALVGALIAGAAIWNLKAVHSPVLQPVSRTMITLPADQRLAGLGHPAIALSPDGTRLAYVAMQGGTQQIYLRALDSLVATPVPGTEDAVNPFFSRDGQWLGFFAGQNLNKFPLNGGPARTVCAAGNPRGGSWGSQGLVAFAPTGVGGLQRVSDQGGAPQLLTHIEKGEVAHRWPEFLPDGSALFFVVGTTASNWANARIAVQSIENGERRNLIQGATQPRYATSGYLLYVQGRSLMAVPFDPQSLTATGAAVPLVDGILQFPSSGAAQYSVSDTGTLVYVPGGAQSAQRRMVWVARDGAEKLLAAPPHAYRGPRISPDGKRVAVSIEEQETQIWLYDLARESLTRMTFDGNSNINAIWTPDGKKVTFASNKEGPVNIFWERADGSGGLERLTSSEYLHSPMSWSPDGQLLVYSEINATTGYDIWVTRVSDHKAQLFLRTPFNESAPRFSPNGKWLAYVSNESGRYEIYVQPYPGPGGKWQISTEGGTEPVWNRNGRELFYRNGDKMIAVDIVTQPDFTAGKPRVLFEGKHELSPGTFAYYDVSPDGQRFLMLKPSEAGETAPTQINVVLNWFEELKRLAPAGNK
jgi:eukaryotic-like serine/threonine-protein kinase